MKQNLNNILIHSTYAHPSRVNKIYTPLHYIFTPTQNNVIKILGANVYINILIWATWYICEIRTVIPLISGNHQPDLSILRCDSVWSCTSKPTAFFSGPVTLSRITGLSETIWGGYWRDYCTIYIKQQQHFRGLAQPDPGSHSSSYQCDS